MTAYRVYSLDSDGLVVRARLLEAKTDEEAASAATDLGWPRWQLWTDAPSGDDERGGAHRVEFPVHCSPPCRKRRGGGATRPAILKK